MIKVLENQAPTKALVVDLPVRDGIVQMEPTQAQDICQIALVERHRARGTTVNGFVSGFGYRGPMALASTVAHDSHHMIVVGTDHDTMARAVNRLHQVGGGGVLYRNAEQAALIELPIAGLMSDQPAAQIAEQTRQLTGAMQDCGCKLNNAFMQHSLLALVVIPELRISDLGLVDVRTFATTDVILSSQ